MSRIQILKGTEFNFRLLREIPPWIEVWNVDSLWTTSLHKDWITVNNEQQECNPENCVL